MPKKKNEEEKEELKITDIFKRVVNTGIGAAFMTEETVKNMLQDLPVGKEIVNGLIQNAKNTKEEFIKTIRSEVKNVLGKVSVSEEIQKVVENYDIEVNAKFKFHRKKNDK